MTIIPKKLLARKVSPEVARLRRQYTRQEWNGTEYEAVLVIGCQYFTFATVKARADVRWFRTQMAHALSVFLAQHKERP